MKFKPGIARFTKKIRNPTEENFTKVKPSAQEIFPVFEKSAFLNNDQVGKEMQ